LDAVLAGLDAPGFALEMSETGVRRALALASLRDKIDAIDAEMHRLLIERGTVIDALIKTKGTDRPGAAFRPAREAEMMRRLVARHEGALPLPTVEHIWREIITTFTRMQAPFDVAIDGSADPARMRDLARFYFGFSVKLITVSNAAAVIRHVGKGNDLGIIAGDRPAKNGAWWRKLADRQAPRIMALLPFIGAEQRPADLPAFVISPPLADPTPPDFRLFAVRVSGNPKRLKDAVVLAVAPGRPAEALIAVPQPLDGQAIAAAAGRAGMTVDRIAEVGGIARGIAIGGARSPVYETVGASP
jgi:chorismate mutase